jgi:hypothetical protein
MQTLTLEEITDGQTWVGLGIAGNQAEHLDQAGETEDFKDVIAPENAPKGMFPWYIPGANSFLSTNPLSSDILTNNGEGYLQPEPEIALVVELNYSNATSTLLDGISVLGFTAFNDCSRRVAAPKISLKKNWGVASQGIASSIIPIKDFDKPNSSISNYRLASFLRRDGKLIEYGKDTAVIDYCYFNQTLTDWITNQINTQEDHGPLEAINKMLEDSKPTYAVIGIGATCYTDFGNSDQRFLKQNDDIYVVAYDSTNHSSSDIEAALKVSSNSKPDSSMIILKQIVT